MQGGGGADSSAIGDEDNAADRLPGRRTAEHGVRRHALADLCGADLIEQFPKGVPGTVDVQAACSERLVQ